MAAPPAADEAETSIVRKVAYIFNPSDDEEEADAGAVSTTPSSRHGRKHRPEDDAQQTPSSKRRRTAKEKGKKSSRRHDNEEHEQQKEDGESDGESALAAFPTLLQGREKPEFVVQRRQLYESTWARLDARVQTVLHEANQATLDAVMNFIDKPIGSKLASAFIVLGPAATTDMLLFKQLSEALAKSESSSSTSRGQRSVRRLVRLRAAEAPNLRTALRTIVQVATTASPAAGGVEEDDVVAHDGHNYLAYDLEAVYAAIRGSAASTSTSDSDSRIVVAFEDSEAFDGPLLADLLAFLHSWLDRIPFVLLFGVATAVDLFQARLPKQAAHRLAAAQFDVAPSSAVLDRLVECAVAHIDVPLRLGPNLLRGLAERQDEQVAGVSVFIKSLKYAFMCYFYGNPLSVLLREFNEEFLSDNREYVASIRQLPSFRRHVEALVAAGKPQMARDLLDDKDDSALRFAVVHQLSRQRRWTLRLLRALRLATASGVFAGRSLTELYIAALEGRGSSGGSRDAEDENASFIASTLAHTIRRMPAPELVALIRRLTAVAQADDDNLYPDADVEPDDDTMINRQEDVHMASWHEFVPKLADIAKKIEALQRKVEADYASGKNRTARGVGGGGGSGPPQLRSKYASQSKVLRTTVVAQKVQLSRDSAALTEEDQAFTELVDAAVAAVLAVVNVEPAEPQKDSTDSPPQPTDLWLQEIWLYDSRTPYRDVFIPKPGLVLERALSRPHDYLACECCGPSGTGRGKNKGREEPQSTGSIQPTLPSTAILYQLYLEAGPLINVADLWEAFQAVVAENKDGQTSNKEDSGKGDEGNEDDIAERRQLVQFYQGLAEMRALGYIKPTRRKVDHVAKVKWL